MDGLSIIIPCWNRENFIARAIDSCLNQDIKNLEVIVVDDGSTDRSVEIIRSYSDNVRLIKIPHRGACAARNAGWKSANYNFIKFLDSDDVFLENSLSAQVNYFKNIIGAGRGDNIIVFGDTLHASDFRLDSIQKSNYGRFPKKRDEQISYLLHNNIQTSSPLHQKKSLEKIGGFDENWPRGQEWNLHLRLCCAGAIFHYQPCIISEVFNHESPQRITKLPIIPQKEPLLIGFLLNELQDISSEKFSTKIEKSIISLLWKHGRKNARLGRYDTAKIFFSTASLQNKNILPLCGSRFYNILVMFFDPIRLEVYFDKIRRASKISNWILHKLDC